MIKSKILQEVLSSDSSISPQTLTSLIPRSITEAKELWNQIIPYSNSNRLSQIHQEFLSELRFSSLSYLESHLPLEALHQRYLRVAKSFIDVKNYSKAETCIKKVNISTTSALSLKLNYFFLKGQVEFYKDEYFFSSFQETSKVCLHLFNEKFRIARFLYVEVCAKLLQAKKFTQLSKVTELVLEISKESNCWSLREVYKEVVMLHVESLIEIRNFEGADAVLRTFEKNKDFLLLSLKKAVYSDSNHEISVLEYQLVHVLSLEELRKAVDIMIYKGKNIETCRILKQITRKHEDYWFYLTWFKLLFALDMVDLLDPSLEYLDMDFVLNRLKSFKETEYLNLLLKYIQELFFQMKYNRVLRITSEFFIPFANKTDLKLSFSLMIQSLIHLNRIDESLDQLKKFNQLFPNEQNKNQCEINALHCICLIKLHIFNENFDDLLETLNFQNLIQVLQELVKINLEKFGEILNRFSKKLLENVNNENEKVKLLMWLVENDQDVKRLYFYLDIAKGLELAENGEGFAFRAWNLAVDMNELDDKLNFIIFAVDFVQKMKKISGISIEIIKNSCKFVLFHRFCQHFEYLYSIFKLIPKDLKNPEYFLILFEFSLIFNELTNDFFSNSLENLQKMAKISKKLSRFDVAKDCLDKIIQIRPDPESLEEILKICQDLDELEHYLKIAQKFYLTCSVQSEVDWFIAFSWNNAVSCPNIERNTSSILWLEYTLPICKAHNSILTEKVETMLTRIKS
jgi:hypothetical protein